MQINARYVEGEPAPKDKREREVFGRGKEEGSREERFVQVNLAMTMMTMMMLMLMITMKMLMMMVKMMLMMFIVVINIINCLSPKS